MNTISHKRCFLSSELAPRYSDYSLRLERLQNVESAYLEKLSNFYSCLAIGLVVCQAVFVHRVGHYFNRSRFWVGVKSFPGVELEAKR